MIAIRRRRAAGVLVSGLWCTLLAVVGCADILGYEYPGNNCRINSDCPPNNVCLSGECGVQCVDVMVDCHANQACLNGLCVDIAVPSTDSGLAPDTAGDETGSDSTSIALDGGDSGACASGCGAGVCWDGGCLQRAIYSSFGPGDPGPSVHTAGVQPNTLYGVQVTLPKAGLLTGLGTYLAPRTQGVTYEFALYTDLGGHPDALEAQTAPFDATAGRNEEAITPIWLPAGAHWVMSAGSESVTYQTLVDPAVEMQNPSWKWEFIDFTFGQQLPLSLDNAIASVGVVPPSDVFIVVAQ